MQKSVKISNNDLQSIFEAAHKNYLDYDRKEMSDQQFMAFCHSKAAIDFLHRKGVQLETIFDNRTIDEPIE